MRKMKGTVKSIIRVIAETAELIRDVDLSGVYGEKDAALLKEMADQFALAWNRIRSGKDYDRIAEFDIDSLQGIGDLLNKLGLGEDRNFSSIRLKGYRKWSVQTLMHSVKNMIDAHQVSGWTDVMGGQEAQDEKLLSEDEVIDNDDFIREQEEPELPDDVSAVSQKETGAVRVTEDIRIITGKPGKIYTAIIKGIQNAIRAENVSMSAGRKLGIEEVIAFGKVFPNLYPYTDDYETNVRNIYSEFDFQEPITVDLGLVEKEGGLRELMERLGLPNGLNSGSQMREKAELEKIRNAVVAALENNEALRPKKPTTFNEAREMIRQKKCVDLSVVAGIGYEAGQAGAVNLISKQLMDDALEDLKATEGLIFRFSSTEYDNVRTALENVIKLHRKLEKFIQADPADPNYGELARKTPGVEELADAYAILDGCAHDYLDKKGGRLSRRTLEDDPDVRGTDRYRLVAELRTVTGPTARMDMKKRMANIDKMLNNARKPKIMTGERETNRTKSSVKSI